MEESNLLFVYDEYLNKDSRFFKSVCETMKEDGYRVFQLDSHDFETMYENREGIKIPSKNRKVFIKIGMCSPDYVFVVSRGYLCFLTLLFCKKSNIPLFLILERGEGCEEGDVFYKYSHKILTIHKPITENPKFHLIGPREEIKFTNDRRSKPSDPIVWLVYNNTTDTMDMGFNNVLPGLLLYFDSSIHSFHDYQVLLEVCHVVIMMDTTCHTEVIIQALAMGVPIASTLDGASCLENSDMDTRDIDLRVSCQKAMTFCHNVEKCRENANLLMNHLIVHNLDTFFSKHYMKGSL